MPHDVFEVQPGMRVTFKYRNWRGEHSERTVHVDGFLWGITEYHPQAGLLLEGIDQDKGERRLFAVKDITDMETVDA